METPNQVLMCCSICKTSKVANEMTSNSRKGKETRCKACQNAYEAKFRKAHREKLNQYHRDWRKTFFAEGEYNKYIAETRKKRIAKLTPDELVAFRKRETDKSKRLSQALKDDVFEAYGGWKCNCCGETERLFLTIDHVLNNGSQLRKEGVHGHSTMFYRWLKKSGYPKEFQVLCMNCNFGKRMNDGVCPHQERRNDYSERKYSQVAGSARSPKWAMR